LGSSQICGRLKVTVPASSFWRCPETVLRYWASHLPGTVSVLSLPNQLALHPVALVIQGSFRLFDCFATRRFALLVIFRESRHVFLTSSPSPQFAWFSFSSPGNLLPERCVFVTTCPLSPADKSSRVFSLVTLPTAHDPHFSPLAHYPSFCRVQLFVQRRHCCLRVRCRLIPHCYAGVFCTSIPQSKPSNFQFF